MWSFTFGQEFPLVLSARLAARTSYAANEETGSFLGDSTGAILGVLGVDAVTDSQGAPLPDAVITSKSGFDYANPVLEPDATVGALACLGVAGLRRVGRR